MNEDAYRVLGVDPGASDDDVKRAYRDLARKYNPELFEGDPLADVAKQKMEELNQAYDAIMGERMGNSAGSAGAGARQQSVAGGSNPLYVQVRYALSQGDWQRAQQLLEQVEVQDAQWHFLTGRVCQMRGWYDQALQQFELACQLDPANAEYRDARERMQYNGRGFSSSPVDAAPCETCAQCAICSLFAQCCCNGCC